MSYMHSDMVIPIPFFQTSTGVATPSMGYDGTEQEINVYPDNSIDLLITCDTAGSHIFYTKNGSQPTHSGDTATGSSTFRIGASSGVINLASHPSNPAPIHYNIIAIGYLPSMADSSPMSQPFSIYRDSGS